jgi:hypothetical protein
MAPAKSELRQGADATRLTPAAAESHIGKMNCRPKVALCRWPVLGRSEPKIDARIAVPVALHQEFTALAGQIKPPDTIPDTCSNQITCALFC